MTFRSETGGPTTQAGIYFQNCIAVLRLAHMLSQVEIDSPSLGTIASVRVEAPESVDDIVVTFTSGAKEYIQAKLTLPTTGDTWEKTWLSFYRQYRDADTRITQFKDAITLAVRWSPEMLNLKTLLTRAETSASDQEWTQRLTRQELHLVENIRGLLAVDIGVLFRFCQSVKVWLLSFEGDPRDTDSFDDEVRRVLRNTVEPINTVFSVLLESVANRARTRGTWTYDDLLGVLKDRGFELPSVMPVSRSTLSSFEVITATFPVVLASENLSFKAAYDARRLFERETIDEALLKLRTAGHILIAGFPQSGKSILALQATAKLLSTNAPGLQDVRAFFCKAADLTEDTLAFLDQRRPTVLIVDDVHFDETKAFELFVKWEACRNRGSCEHLYLVFVSQWIHDQDEPRRSNLFHLHARNIVRASFDEKDFKGLVWHAWRDTTREELTDEVFHRIRVCTKKSPALAILAIGVAQSILSEGRINESDFNELLLSRVQQSYSLQDVGREASEACVMAHFDVPIRTAAFGQQRAEGLIDRGFLVRVPGASEYMVFSRAAGELWFHEKHFDYDSDEVQTILEQYVTGDSASNYEDVLLGVRTVGPLKILRGVINNCYPILKDRIKRESDLYKAATSLDCIAEVYPRIARDFLEASLQLLSLAERFDRSRDVSAIGRYLSVATRIDRTLLTERPRIYQGITLQTFFLFLRKILVEAETDLGRVATVCVAVARSSKSLARKLVAEVCKPAPESASPDEKRAQLTFAGRISWFDPEGARRIVGTLAPKQLTNLLLGTHHPRSAAHVIESIARLNSRVATAVLHELAESDALERWAEGLDSSTVNLYDIGNFLFVMEQTNRSLAARIATRLYPFLKRSILSDTRLPAIGYVLSVLRRLSYQLAAETLTFIKNSFDLGEILSFEISPVRFGRTIEAIATIDRNTAASYVEALTDDDWFELLERAPRLFSLAVLFRGVASAAWNPDGIIGRILRHEGVRYKLERLVLRGDDAWDLACYAMIVAASCPLSLDTKRELLTFLSPDVFERTIRSEQNARKAGQALRAYAVAFPAQSYTFFSTLEGSKKILAHWLSTEDISEAAYLLHAVSEVDGRLGDSFGALIRQDEALALLESEPKGTRAAEYLYALTQVAPILAQELTSKLFKRARPLDLIRDSRDLRELTTILRAVNRCHPKFYKHWLNNSLNKKQTKEAIELELLTRSREESNLDIQSQLISLVYAFDREMAANIIRGLDYEWIESVGRWDNHIAQVLQFIRTVAYLSFDSAGTFIDENLRFRLRKMLSENVQQRMGQVISPRTLSICLAELLKASRALDLPEIVAKGWEAINESRITQVLEYTDDIVGAALLSFLLAQYRDSKSALSTSKLAADLVMDSASGHQAVSAMISLALVGAQTKDLEARGIIKKLKEFPGQRAWEMGFANWLSSQRAYLDGAGNPGTLLVGREQLGLPTHELSDEHLAALNQESRRAGNNLRFAFVVAFAWQLQVHESQTLIIDLDTMAHRRSTAEARRGVNELLNEFSKGLTSLGSSLPLENIDSVPLYVRDLSPRIEAIADPGEV